MRSTATHRLEGSALGRAIGDARRRRGLSYRQLSVLTGVATGHLYDIEMAVAPRPGWVVVVRIARALELSLDTLAVATVPLS